jgi:hypothetical protein
LVYDPDTEPYSRVQVLGPVVLKIIDTLLYDGVLTGVPLTAKDADGSGKVVRAYSLLEKLRALPKYDETR